MREKSYYVTVHDKLYYTAKWNKIEDCSEFVPCKEYWVPKRVVDDRVFTSQFESSISKTLESAIVDFLKNDQCTDVDTILTYQDIIERMYFDEETGCYCFYEFLTKGTMLHPKSCQWDKYYEGEYEFYAIRHEFQVLKTEIPNMDSEAILDECHTQVIKYMKKGM